MPDEPVRMFRPTFFKRVIRTEKDEYQTSYFFDDAIETPDSLVVAVMMEPPHIPTSCANMFVELEGEVYYMTRWVGDYMFSVRHDARPVKVEYEVHP